MPAPASPATLALFERTIKSELGKAAKVAIYDPEGRTPMSFVLDRVARRLNKPFATYWVSKAPADVFCLRVGDALAAIFNQRHVELSAQFLQLFTFPAEAGLLAEMSERLCCRVIGEFALKHGEVDLAVLCFLKSKFGESVLIADPGNVDDLEVYPISERYMFGWFFGLLHELGHQHAADPVRQKSLVRAFPDDDIRSVLFEIMEDEGFNADLRPAAERMLAHDPLFAPAQLREESSADLFACEVMLEATRDILQEVGPRHVDPIVFACEHVLTLNVMSLIERCKIIAGLVSARAPATIDQIMKLSLHHAAIQFRGRVAQRYATQALAAFPPRLTPKELGEAVAANGRESLASLNAIQDGYRAAMRYAKSAKLQADDQLLLEGFRKSLQEVGGAITKIEARRFCQIARSMGREGRLLTIMEQIIAEPSKPVPPPFEGYLLVVPWVTGPGGLSRPFTLKTKYGPIAFVFQPDSPILETFFGISAEGLKEGYELKQHLFVAPRVEALGSMILKQASDESGFGVICEGQDGFNTLIQELASGELFDEDGQCSP